MPLSRRKRRLPGSPAREVVERSVAEQSNFLTPVLAGTSGACPRCFGAMPSIPVRCSNCLDASHRGRGKVADLVTPLTYRVGYQHHNQAAHDLRAYKADPPAVKHSYV